MLTTVDTLVILTSVAICWVAAGIALDRIVALITRHVR